MKCYSIFKKEEILLFPTTWVNVEEIMLNKISQAQKDKYRMFLHIEYKIVKLKATYFQLYKIKNSGDLLFSIVPIANYSVKNC